MIDTRNTRFFRWYRAIPITLLICMVILSVCVDLLPPKLVRSLFFPVTYAERIDDAAARYDVDPHLIAAIIRCESGWNETAQSAAGAVGLMQIMPDTAKTVADMDIVDTARYNPNDLTDPATNIEYGTALLSYLQTELGDQDEVIAAYNAGLGTVQEWNASSEEQSIAEAITYPETHHYLERVKESMRQYAKYYPNGMSVA